MQVEGNDSLTVICRFVPYDLWLATHVSQSWRTKQAKQWLLYKCISSVPPPDLQAPLRHRPVSPIKFASSLSRSSHSSPPESPRGLYDDDDESDEELDLIQTTSLPDIRKYRNKQQEYYKHAVTSSISSSPTFYAGDTKQPFSSKAESNLACQYRLLSFSTGQLLEDDFTLSWYKLRPYELLEMHHVTSDMRLPREIMLEYVQPVFEAKVQVLRAIWREADRSSYHQESSGGKVSIRSGKKSRSRSDQETSGDKEKDKGKKRPKTNMEWRERWAVIRQGVFTIGKGRADSNPHSYPLRHLSAIRDAEYAQKVALVPFTLAANHRVICTRWEAPSASVAKEKSKSKSSPNSSIPSTPTDDGLRESEKDEGDAGEDHAGKTEREWLVMDMLDNDAYTSVLRILHRLSPNAPSSFIGSSHSDPHISSLYPAHVSGPHSLTLDGTIPYPEWRMNMVNKAQMSGMGEINTAMRWVLWGDESVLVKDSEKMSRSGSESEGGRARGEARVSVVHETDESEVGGEDEVGNGGGAGGGGGEHDVGKSPDTVRRYQDSEDGNDPDSDYDDDISSTGTSEAEWEGWANDLERQGRVQKQLRHQSSSKRSTRSHSHPRQQNQHPSKQASREQLQNHQERLALEPSGVVSTPSSSGGSPSLTSPSSTESLRPDQPSKYSTARFSASPSSSAVSVERSTEKVMRDGGVFVPRPSSPLFMDPFMLPPNTVITSTTVSAGNGKGKGKEKDKARKGRARSATVTAVGSFLNKRKGKEKEANGEKDETEKQEASETAADRDKERERERGKLKKSDQRRPKLSLAFPPPNPPLPTAPDASSDVQSSLSVTPTTERYRPSMLRHARSGSSLQVPSSSTAHGNEVDDDDATVNGNEEKKKKRGLVRGVSVRAEKLMRGLDSALDFVDGPRR